MKPKVILDSHKFEITINRLCRQLIENHNDFSETVLLGIQPRGVYLCDRISKTLKKTLKGNKKVKCGSLDITFYRDDFKRKELVPAATDIDFSLEDKKVVLIDDVLFTGRTIRSAMDALMAFGRPKSVELMVLVDRRFSRHLPIQPDYIGKSIDSIASQKVKVEWKDIDGKDLIWLMANET